MAAPEHVIRAGIGAIEAGHTRYGPPAGLPALRQAIAEDAGRRRGSYWPGTSRPLVLLDFRRSLEVVPI